MIKYRVTFEIEIESEAENAQEAMCQAKDTLNQLDEPGNSAYVVRMDRLDKEVKDE
jgi:hypothetical protein